MDRKRAERGTFCARKIQRDEYDERFNAEKFAKAPNSSREHPSRPEMRARRPVKWEKIRKPAKADRCEPKEFAKAVQKGK